MSWGTASGWSRRRSYRRASSEVGFGGARSFDAAEEAAIRSACCDAIGSLVDESGLSQVAVDGFFFANARRVCVEVEPPRCGLCVAADTCAQRTELFQPGIRTTAY